MIVAVLIARVVQVVAHQIVHVIAVRDRLVSTRRSMLVRLLVPCTGVIRSAYRGVGRADVEAVLVHVVSVGVMHVTLVQVVAMAIVLDGPVAAAVAVDMGMARVNGMIHGYLLSIFGSCGSGDGSSGFGAHVPGCPGEYRAIPQGRACSA